MATQVATCRGSYSLGSACGDCFRCAGELNDMVIGGLIASGTREEEHKDALAYYAKKQKEKPIQGVYTGYGDKEIMEREETFDKLALEIFSHYTLHEHIQLLCPQCLVRILPKDMMIGSIYVPDVASTNKPTYEGIVIRTWLPHLIPTSKDEMREMRSELAPGDHVLFPHFAGQPLPGLNEGKYRCIPEGITRNGRYIFGNDTGCIFAKLDYKRPRVQDVFKNIVHEYFQLPENEPIWPDMLRRLKQEFDISVKIKGSRTKSGV